MELHEYIRLFRKWLWLILLAAFLSGSVGFIVRSNQPDRYRSQVILNVGGFIQAPNPDSGEIRAGQELAATYSEIVKTYNVLQATAEALDLPALAPDIGSGEDLSGLIDVRIIPGTSLLAITVTYVDPLLTADIANEIARQLLLNSPTNLTPDQQRQIDLANQQIETLAGQLQASREQLDFIDIRLLSVQDPAEAARLSGQRNTLIDQINNATANIARFSETLVNLQQRTNSVEIIEAARVATRPIGNSVFRTTLLAAMVGAALAVGVVLLVEYLNDTIRVSEEAARILSAAVVGVIPRYGKRRDGYWDRLIINLPFMSPVAESYRTLATNLTLSASEGMMRYVITSPGPEEGKSLTTANLGIALAWAGKRVLLIDGDLRRSRLHEIFELENKIGLTTLLNARDETILSDAQQATAALAKCVQSSGVERLYVIPGGLPPKNPSDVLVSANARRWLEMIQHSGDYDMLLIDTPPALIAADSSILAAAAGAAIVMVVNAGKTRAASALKVREQLALHGGEVKGVILNAADAREESYYGYNYYYYQPEAQPSRMTRLWNYFRGG